METVPLAERLRPQNLDEVVGQDHLVGKDKPLRIAVETGRLFSMIFWGPPGSGKTTLARLISKETGFSFTEYSAVAARKADIIAVVTEAKNKLAGFGRRTVLFVDEIHRFNKAQQASFLPYVEDGTITLIGATTENPSFEVISPLLSRCLIFVLNPLSVSDLEKIAKRAAKELNLTVPKDASDFVAAFANGDGRQAINLLEAAANLYKTITVDNLKSSLQSKFLRYDTVGEEHYGSVSALIKSMRASNVDAALYYLARMVESGEDPLFIARRMVIFASEDIGTAQPTALVVANGVFRACETIGYPECAINLAHAAVYLCKAPKNRNACEAYFRALDDVKKYGNLAIPLNLRNAPTKMMKDLGYGAGYEKYTKEDLLPDELKGRKYYLEEPRSGD